MNYPEHEKLAAVQQKSQAIGEFLSWLVSEENVVLCRFRSADISKRWTCVCQHDRNEHRTSKALLLAAFECLHDDCDCGEYVSAFETEGFFPERNSIEEWLARYFDVDLDVIEAEKRAMLDELRERSGG